MWNFIVHNWYFFGLASAIPYSILFRKKIYQKELENDPPPSWDSFKISKLKNDTDGFYTILLLGFILGFFYIGWLIFAYMIWYSWYHGNQIFETTKSFKRAKEVIKEKRLGRIAKRQGKNPKEIIKKKPILYRFLLKFYN